MCIDLASYIYIYIYIVTASVAVALPKCVWVCLVIGILETVTMCG